MQIKINKSNPVLVIGSGVMGLTSAIRLQESGFTVRIVTRDLPPHTTSDAAAAYWFPEGEPYDRVQIWGRDTYYALQKMTQIPEAGVSIQRYTRLLAETAHRSGKEVMLHLPIN